MENNIWWKEGMQVIQYNLQVTDTPLMNCGQIAEDTKRMGANVVVINVGGIYAWYASHVPYHHINEFLPKDMDLLGLLIKEFHKRDIRFIARFDFSLADDKTYLQKPQWFARHRDKTPYYVGEKRMGDWSLLLRTCATGGYSNEEVAVPILQEVLDTYDIDGIFFNAPFANPCFCERCQEKYLATYGVPMPENAENFPPDWLSRNTKNNIAVLYKAIKARRPEVPLILYYAPYEIKHEGFSDEHRDNVYDRLATADLLCTESQDVLSRGINRLPGTNHPILAMKAGQMEDPDLRPFGIIHSCPGMDWRHTGLPPAEYLPWMAQVPAAGGVLWHSLTGFADTVTDKRIFQAVSTVNHWASKCGPLMKGSLPYSQVLLLWDGGPSAREWANILVKNHIQFDLMHDYRMDGERMKTYQLVIAPDCLLKDSAQIALVHQYVQGGGHLILENTDPHLIKTESAWIGVTKECIRSENLVSSYLLFEQKGKALSLGMDVDRLPFGGGMLYCQPLPESIVLATLVPPFAPLSVVGVPPERASIPVPHTDIPLCISSSFGLGNVLLLPFALYALSAQYGLYDYFRFAYNAIMYMVAGQLKFVCDAPYGVQISCYKKEDTLLIHFVNEIGARPLLENIPVFDLQVSLLREANETVASVRSVIANERVSYKVSPKEITITLGRLDIWDMVAITLSEEYK